MAGKREYEHIFHNSFHFAARVRCKATLLQRILYEIEEMKKWQHNLRRFSHEHTQKIGSALSNNTKQKKKRLFS